MVGKDVPHLKGRSNMVIVLSGASGSGKTTLARRLIEMVPGVEKSISYTTRKPRADEIPGVAYHFVSEHEFKEMVKRKAFIEWAEVHGHYYGTSAEQLARRLDDGMEVVCDIDVQGGASIRKLFKGRSVLVFILPPSWAELERRLRARGTDSDEVIEGRLDRARDEHRKASTYDFLVVNSDISAASAAVSDIVRAERLRTRRIRPVLPPGLLLEPRSRRKARSGTG
jgi:guanylate kinase